MTSRRRFLKNLGMCATALWADPLLSRSDAQAQRHRFNVLMIPVDDLRPQLVLLRF